MIDYNKFKEIEMRTATVLEAQTVEGSENLLRLTVDIGTEKRQIVAGIAKSYSPGEMVGKQIVVVANLESRTIRGQTSNGMLLAVGETHDSVVLLTIDKKVENGMLVR